MSDLISKVSPVIDKTIAALNSKRFVPDPIGGKHFSKITSLMSSAYKRHGFILEKTILERLNECTDLEVWEDKEFKVSQLADHMVDASFQDPVSLIGNSTFCVTYFAFKYY